MPAFFSCLWILGGFVPWVPPSWAPPCNNEWALVLHDAFVQRLQFGSDVVFTFGPFGFLYYGVVPATAWWTYLSWTAIAVAFWQLAWGIGKSVGFAPWVRGLWIVAISLPVCSVDVVDAEVFLFVGLVVVRWFLSGGEQRWSDFFLIGVLALLSSVKISWALVIGPVLLLFACIGLLRQRRLGAWLPLYLLFLAGLWLLAGQHFPGFPQYLLRAIEVAGAFAEAMQKSATWERITRNLFLALAIQLLAGAWFCARKRERSWLLCFGFFASLSYLLFVVFKAGYVRQDHHEVVAVCSLVSFGLAGAIFLPLNSDRQTLVAATTGLLPGIALCMVVFSLNLPNQNFQPRFASLISLEGCRGLGRMLIGKPLWKERYPQDMERIRGRFCFPSMDLPVDIYPWGAANLAKASGLPYKPRPVYEGYAAYTKNLAKINADFLNEERAPKYVFFDLRFLDGRLPAMDDGYSWPELWTRYEVVQEHGAYLGLKQRVAPGSFRKVPLGEMVVERGIPFSLPEADSSGFIWAEIDLPLSLQGRLKRFLYKPGVVLIRLNVAAGFKAFRLIPGVAEAGFLLSPALVTKEQFAAVMRGTTSPILDDARVKSVVLGGEGSVEDDYEWSRARIRFFRLELAIPAASATARDAVPVSSVVAVDI
ncbi:MAG: conserved rane protein of unknown function [Chthoniobacteraceae bacterium]|nr:conserved rane protein of unknown function [Chthoniobacteraceae bacterium]